MSALVSLAASAASMDASGVFRRLRRNLLVFVLLSLLALSAYLLLTVAALQYFWLITGSFIQAALICAAIMIVCAAVIFAVYKLMERQERLRAARRQQTDFLVAATALSLLPKVIGSRTGLIAVAAGFLAYHAYQRIGGNAETDD